MVACDNCGKTMDYDGEKVALTETVVKLYCPACGHQDEIPVKMI